MYPLYPVWADHNTHQSLPTLLDYLRFQHQGDRSDDPWLPTWTDFTPARTSPRA